MIAVHAKCVSGEVENELTHVVNIKLTVYILLFM